MAGEQAQHYKGHKSYHEADFGPTYYASVKKADNAADSTFLIVVVAVVLGLQVVYVVSFIVFYCCMRRMDKYVQRVHQENENERQAISQSLRNLSVHSSSYHLMLASTTLLQTQPVNE